MPPITSFAGTTLLATSAVEEIKKQADLLLKQKDVAQSWQAAQHIKKELAGLPPEKLSVFLTEYRTISANLKALAFPILESEEAFSLLENNLQFISSEYLPSLGLALFAWTDLQDNPAEIREKIIKLLDRAGAAGAQLKTVFTGSIPAELTSPKKVELVPSYEMFDNKERDELSEHAELVNKISPTPLAQAGVQGLATAIFARVKTDVDKESFLRRAEALATSRLRDVRTTAQLNEYLSRPFAVGGLGLEGDNLALAGRLVEDEYLKLHQAGPSLPKTPSLDKEPVAEAAVVLDGLEEKENLDTKNDGAAPVSVPTPVPTPVPITPQNPAVFDKPKDVKAVTVMPSKTAPSLAQVRQLASSDKPRLSDIKSPSQAATSRTLSAADELKLVTLADFRNWGNKEAATGEILRRIGLLAKESLGSKIQGIRMFRESELFKDYVRIGQASLSAGKKLAEAIADKTINPNQMTEDEFFAIASLNSKLK